MKRLSLSLATASIASFLMATGALADTSYFAYQHDLEDDDIIDLGTVTSVGDGVVEIYRFHGGEVGELLGTTEVHAGANSDVRIRLDAPPHTDIMAVLTVQGQTVATRNYRLE